MNTGLDRLVARDASRAAAIVAALPQGDDRTRLLSVASSALRATGSRGRRRVGAYARSSGTRARGKCRSIRRIARAASRVRPRGISRRAAAHADLLVDRQRIDRTQRDAVLASRVARIDDGPVKTQLIMSLVQIWAERRGDPEGALAWISANEATVPPEAFERVAFVYARSNPTGAAAYVDRAPNRVRAAWIAAVTVGYATTDVQGATQFLERFRGEPGFDRGAPQLATRIAETDPPAAARLLASVGTRGPDGASPGDHDRADLGAARSPLQRPRGRSTCRRCSAASCFRSSQELGQVRILRPWVNGRSVCRPATGVTRRSSRPLGLAVPRRPTPRCSAGLARTGCGRPR